jgi:hypothetical protein
VHETTTFPPPAAADQPGLPPADEFGLRLLRPRRGHGGLVLRARLLPTAALLTAVQLVLTGSRLSRGWFWQDDLNLLAGAARHPLSPGLLFSNYNGHLVPGSWALAWVLDRIAPLAWWPAALITLVTVAATDLMMLALLRRLFGDRPAILLPYALFCATSLTLTATLWWAAMLQWLPVTLALITAFWFHAGYLRDHRRADAIGAWLSVLAGLLFFEKALIIPVVLALFTVGYAVPGPLWRRPLRAFWSYRGYWLAQAALAGGYLWLYLSRVTIETGPGTGSGEVLTTVRLMIFETLLPSLIGGPLRWYTTPGTTINAWPYPQPWLIAVAAVLAVVAVGGSLLLVRGAWRAWALLTVFLGISITLVVHARLGFIGSFVGRDHRYLTDAAVMVPLCLALAWLPLRDGLDAVLVDAYPAKAQPGEAQLGKARAGEAQPGGPSSGIRERRRAALQRYRGSLAIVAALSVLAITVGGAVSGEKFMHSWTRNPSQSYLGNLAAGLAAHPGPVYLFGDEVVPDLVMTPTFLESRRIGRITQPMAVRPRVAAVVPYFSVVDPAGHLHNGMVRGYNAVIPKGLCGSDQQPPIAIPLPAVPGVGQWKLRLGYYANRQTSARVAVGNQPAVTMRLERGLHQVFVSLHAGGDSSTVTVSGLDQDAAVCVGDAVLGFPVAAS